MYSYIYITNVYVYIYIYINIYIYISYISYQSIPRNSTPDFSSSLDQNSLAAPGGRMFHLFGVPPAAERFARSVETPMDHM